MMKTRQRLPLDDYLRRSYPFNVIAAEEGGFVVVFPDLPGCITQVDSADEIGPMAEDARRLWIEVEYESGSDIPLPSQAHDYSGRFNVRIPKSLHKSLAETAEREGVSLNQWIVSLLSAANAGTRPDSLPVRSTALAEPLHARILNLRTPEGGDKPKRIPQTAIRRLDLPKTNGEVRIA